VKHVGRGSRYPILRSKRIPSGKHPQIACLPIGHDKRASVHKPACTPGWSATRKLSRNGALGVDSNGRLISTTVALTRRADTLCCVRLQVLGGKDFGRSRNRKTRAKLHRINGPLDLVRAHKLEGRQFKSASRNQKSFSSVNFREPCNHPTELTKPAWWSKSTSRLTVVHSRHIFLRIAYPPLISDPADQIFRSGRLLGRCS
jgi:hypothetical protein